MAVGVSSAPGLPGRLLEGGGEGEGEVGPSIYLKTRL